MIQYRDITDLILFDASPVTYPAYTGTSTGARAAAKRQSLWPDGVPAEVRSHIPALRDLRDDDDDPIDPADDPGAGDTDPDNDDDAIAILEDCECNCRACYGGDCDECDDYMAQCPDAQNCGNMAAARAAHAAKETRDAAKTKRVDGEDLPASAFAYVGDANDVGTWKFPIKFSTDDKTKSHIQNALARWGQATDIPDSEKPKVFAKIKAAANQYGIHVSDGDETNSAPPVMTLEQARARTETLRAQNSLHIV